MLVRRGPGETGFYLVALLVSLCVGGGSYCIEATPPPDILLLTQPRPGGELI